MVVLNLVPSTGFSMIWQGWLLLLVEAWALNEMTLFGLFSQGGIISAFFLRSSSSRKFNFTAEFEEPNSANPIS